jgi:hypothetical protein
MLVYTLLFTLTGKDPSSNKYIDMFYIWLSYLIKNGGLTNQDIVVVLTDPVTVDFINSTEAFSVLSEDVPFDLQFHTIPQPGTITRGILERYLVKHPIFFQNICLFLDLDVLVVNSFKHLFQSVIRNSMILFPEGSMFDSNYGGSLVVKENDEKLSGFTAGTYAFTMGEDIQKFFASIVKECLEYEEKPLYTIDQPFFNKFIYNRIKGKQGKFSIFLIPEKHMETNTNDTTEDTIFINYCGDVGSGTSHLQKLLQKLCLDFIQSGNLKE